MMNKYTFFWKIWIFISLIYTKIFFPGKRLIRLPFDIRNKKYIKIGNNFTCGIACRLEAFPLNFNGNPVLIIGNDVQMNDFVHISASTKVEIGNNVLLASKIFISDLNHGSYDEVNSSDPFVRPANRDLSSSPVVIKDNVWIGESVCIMPGLTIGYGSIIGALSVITKDVPDLCIVVGNPGRVIKKFDKAQKKWIKV
jgi:acetyltransferase-like isoleucine patch superfamily enzyme